MPITEDQGVAFTNKYLATLSAGFANNSNNHNETMKGIFADHLSWDWSDNKGSGTVDDIMGIMSTTWGLMLDSWVFPSPIIVVDTENSKVVVSGPVVLNVTGGLADENNPISFNNSFMFDLNDELKAVSWTAIWDNKYPPMVAALEKITARLEAINAEKTMGVEADPAAGRVAMGQ